VNRGLNCVKGYFNGKINYGKDRLTQPLLRMTDGKFDKKGKFTPISWEQAIDIMEEKMRWAMKEKAHTAFPSSAPASTPSMRAIPRPS